MIPDGLAAEAENIFSDTAITVFESQSSVWTSTIQVQPCSIPIGYLKLCIGSSLANRLVPSSNRIAASA